jgi:hypothetical protein
MALTWLAEFRFYFASMSSEISDNPSNFVEIKISLVDRDDMAMGTHPRVFAKESASA